MQIILPVSTSSGQRQQTQDVCEDSVTRIGLQTRITSTKTHVRLANGQQVNLAKVCDVSFTLAQHEFLRTFHVILDLRSADIVLGLPWFDDEQARLEFGNERSFTLINGAEDVNQVMDRRFECLLISSIKANQLMRKSTKSKEWTAKVFTLHLRVHRLDLASKFWQVRERDVHKTAFQTHDEI
jgi:hypothetical protein